MSFGYVPLADRRNSILRKMFGWMYAVRRIQAPFVVRMLDLKSDSIFIDIGCGGGNFVSEMSKRCVSIGLDIIPEIKSLSFVQKKRKNLHIIRGDALRIPFKDNTVDAILLGGTLQAIKQEHLLLNECHRILRNNGLLVIYIVTQRKGIKSMYKNKISRCILVNAFHLTDTYANFEKYYIKKINMTRFYTIDDLTYLLNIEGFGAEEMIFAPSIIGSLIHDILFLVTRRFNLPGPNHPIYFPFIYPLLYIAEKLSRDKSSGNELILKVRKLYHNE